MTNKQKLKYAHEHYPKGTKVCWPSDLTETGFTVSGKYHIPEGTLSVMDSECDYHSIFNGRDWIDLVREPSGIKKIPKEVMEQDFPELYDGTFECEICGNRLDEDCQASPGICGHCEANEK